MRKDFELTPIEADIVQSALWDYRRTLIETHEYCETIGDPRTNSYPELIAAVEQLLTRIKQWQDETLDSER